MDIRLFHAISLNADAITVAFNHSRIGDCLAFIGVLTAFVTNRCVTYGATERTGACTVSHQILIGLRVEFNERSLPATVGCWLIYQATGPTALPASNNKHTSHAPAATIHSDEQNVIHVSSPEIFYIIQIDHQIQTP